MKKTDVETMALRYKRLKETKAKRDAELEELRATLLEIAPDGGIFGRAALKVIESERKTISLKALKEDLSRAIFERYVAGSVKVSKVITLKVESIRQKLAA